MGTYCDGNVDSREVLKTSTGTTFETIIYKAGSVLFRVWDFFSRKMRDFAQYVY